MANSTIQIDDSWSLFLDRDGVINKRNFHGYITCVEDFEFENRALDAFKDLATAFKLIVVVTNQQGVGKNIMSERNLNEIHSYMNEQIVKADGRLDAIYYSPDLRSKEYNTRKPSAAMAEIAKTEFPQIDFKKSIMVGDTDSDIVFGKNLGMKTVLIRSEEKVSEHADYSFNSLYELAMHLERL